MAKTYSEKLRDPRWQKTRLLVMDRDEFTCKYCGFKEEEFNVHHLKYAGEPWEGDLEDKITLCRSCHRIVEGIKERYINYGWVVVWVRHQRNENKSADYSGVLIKHSEQGKAVLFFTHDSDPMFYTQAIGLDNLLEVLLDFQIR